MFSGSCGLTAHGVGTDNSVSGGTGSLFCACGEGWLLHLAPWLPWAQKMWKDRNNYIPAGQSQILSVLLLGEDAAARLNKLHVPELPRRLKLISIKLKKKNEVPATGQGWF